MEILKTDSLPLVITRGDTVQYDLFINDGSILMPIRHELKENEMVFIGIMEYNQLFEDALIRKTYTYESDKTEDGDIIYSLSPEDTEYVYAGTYYIEAKLWDRDSDSVRTVIPKKLVYIQD